MYVFFLIPLNFHSFLCMKFPPLSSSTFPDNTALTFKIQFKFHILWEAFLEAPDRNSVSFPSAPSGACVYTSLEAFPLSVPAMTGEGHRGRDWVLFIYVFPLFGSQWCGVIHNIHVSDSFVTSSLPRSVT